MDGEFAAAGAGAGVLTTGRAVEALVGALGVDPGAVGAGDGGELFGGVGDDLAVGHEGRDVPEYLVGEVGMVGRVEVGELLGSEQQAYARGASAAEQARDAVGRDGAELVDEDERREGLVLLVGRRR
jgi:hypothetical protein